MNEEKTLDKLRIIAMKEGKQILSDVWFYSDNKVEIYYNQMKSSYGVTNKAEDEERYYGGSPEDSQLFNDKLVKTEDMENHINKIVSEVKI